MYQCPVCSKTLLSLQSYCKHYTFHRNLPRIQFQCPVLRQCGKGKFCSSLNALQVHISRHHKEESVRTKKSSSLLEGSGSRPFDSNVRSGKSQSDVSYGASGSNSKSSISRSNLGFVCSVSGCLNPICRDVKDLIGHLKIHIMQGCEILCPVIGCNSHFIVKSSFSSHLSRQHSDINNKIGRPVSVEFEAMCDATSREFIEKDIEDPNTTLELDDMDELGSDVARPSSEYLDSGIDFEDSLTSSLALFYIKLQAKFLVPQSTIQFIVEEISNLSSLGWNHMKSVIQAKFILHDESINSLQEFLNDLEGENILEKVTCIKSGPFRSVFLRNSYFKQKFNHVPPVHFKIGENEKGPVYGYYIPIEETIRCLFSDPSFVKQYKNPLKKSQNILYDIQDGTICSGSSFYDNKHLQILLYQDAFEIVNPIGAAKTKHKMIGVYFTLGNIFPWHRSKIDTIQLCILCREKDLTRFGARAVFSRFITDIKRFESDGFSNLPEIGDNIKGSVVMCMGDNLGSHCLGGFVESFSGTYFCRYCLHTRNDADMKPKESRTKENYNEAIDYLKENPSTNNYKGIKVDSVLNTLSHFHACSGFPPCLAHDLFEGVVSYDMQLIVDYFVSNKWLTYDFINNQIEKFSLKLSDAIDRPCPLKPGKNKMAGNVMQLWCFLRLFPILFSHNIKDKQDKVWRLYIGLKETVECICAPELSVPQVSLLDDRIVSYIDERIKVFSKESLKPKHHYLLHYASLTLRYGPLIRVWTMRMESKHSYFKRCIRRFQNFKNIGKTLSEQHQLLQAYYSSGSLFDKDLLFNDASPYCPTDCSKEVENCLKSKKIPSENLLICSKMSYRGMSYFKDQYLMLKDTKDRLMIGKCVAFIINVNMPYCMVEMFEAVYLGAYGVHRLIPLNESENNLQFLEFNHDVFDYYPLACYKVFGGDCISLKHSPVLY